MYPMSRKVKCACPVLPERGTSVPNRYPKKLLTQNVPDVLERSSLPCNEVDSSHHKCTSCGVIIMFRVCLSRPSGPERGTESVPHACNLGTIWTMLNLGNLRIRLGLINLCAQKCFSARQVSALEMTSLLFGKANRQRFVKFSEL